MGVVNGSQAESEGAEAPQGQVQKAQAGRLRQL